MLVGGLRDESRLKRANVSQIFHSIFMPYELERTCFERYFAILRLEKCEIYHESCLRITQFGRCMFDEKLCYIFMQSMKWKLMHDLAWNDVVDENLERISKVFRIHFLTIKTRTVDGFWVLWCREAVWEVCLSFANKFASFVLSGKLWEWFSSIIGKSRDFLKIPAFVSDFSWFLGSYWEFLLIPWELLW